MRFAYVARSDSQAEAIRKAVLKSVKARDAYSEDVASLLFEALEEAEDQVARSILRVGHIMRFLTMARAIAFSTTAPSRPGRCRRKAGRSGW